MIIYPLIERVESAECENYIIFYLFTYLINYYFMMPISSMC